MLHLPAQIYRLRQQYKLLAGCGGFAFNCPQDCRLPVESAGGDMGRNLSVETAGQVVGRDWLGSSCLSNLQVWEAAHCW